MTFPQGSTEKQVQIVVVVSLCFPRTVQNGGRQLGGQIGDRSSHSHWPTNTPSRNVFSAWGLCYLCRVLLSIVVKSYFLGVLGACAVMGILKSSTPIENHRTRVRSHCYLHSCLQVSAGLRGIQGLWADSK